MIEINKYIIEKFKELSINREVDKNTNYEYLTLDIDKLYTNMPKEQVKYIDYFPEIMGEESAHSILERFYKNNMTERESYEYEIIENKFLRTILLLVDQKEIIVSSTYLSFANDEEFTIIASSLDNNLIKVLNSVKKPTIDLSENEDKMDILLALIKLALKDKIITTIYMPTVNLMIQVKDLGVIIYRKDQSWAKIEKICMTEGLYLREVN